MGKVGLLLVVAVVLWLLLKPQVSISGGVSTGGRPPGYDYYGAAPPGQDAYSSPPSSRPNAVSDIINHAIDVGGKLAAEYISPPDDTSTGAW